MKKILTTKAKRLKFRRYLLAAKAGDYMPLLREAEKYYQKGYRNKEHKERARRHYLKWMGQAAEQGDGRIQYDLGSLYKDLPFWLNIRSARYHQELVNCGVKAVKYFRLAAENSDFPGRMQAKLRLGELFYGGFDGVEKNKEEGNKWFATALKEDEERERGALLEDGDYTTVQEEIIAFKVHKDWCIDDTVIPITDQCGCFACGHIFNASDIPEWVEARRGYIWCPFCDTDTVICESCGQAITDGFLRSMHDVWYGGRRFFGEKETEL